MQPGTAPPTLPRETMARRILALLRARLSSAQQGAAIPVAALLMQATVAGVLCGLVADLLPPYAFGLFALAVSAALVALPLLGELGYLLRADEAGDWVEALPARPFELKAARTLHLLIALAVLSLGSLLPAALLPGAPLGLAARLALPALGLLQALVLASGLLALQAALGGRAQGLLPAIQTLLFAGLVVGGVMGLRLVGDLLAVEGPGELSPLAFGCLPPAWFAAPLAPGLSAHAWLAPLATVAAALLLLAVPPPRVAAARRGGTLLGRLLAPARALARRLWLARDERASFELVFEALPREREFVLRSYPLLGIPIAFLAVGARGESGPQGEGLLALLLFTPPTYLPVLLSQVPGTLSHRARWLLDLAPLSPSAIHAGTVKALAVRFLLPLYALLFVLCASLGGIATAVRLALPAALLALAVLRFTYPAFAVDPPLSVAPDRIRTRRNMFELMIGLAILTTLAAVLALKLVVSVPVALLVSAALLFVKPRPDELEPGSS